LEELENISHFSSKENVIRYGIFGGSAQHFLGADHGMKVSGSYSSVIIAMVF
jgi:hypothetical protein